MGYALFANRKIYCTNLVFRLQSELDNICQRKMSLMNFSANISDGVVTVEEIASDASNLSSYKDYLEGYEEWKTKSDDEGGAATTIGEIQDMASQKNNSDQYMATIAELINTPLNEKYAEQVKKKLEALENELDMKQKNIETKLTAAQKQLEAVEQAEGKAIESATPKYAGIQ